MRLILYLKSKGKYMDLGYRTQIVSKIHNLLLKEGKNKWHDTTSLYSFSGIYNTKYDKAKKKLKLSEEVKMVITSWDEEFIEVLCSALEKDNEFPFDLVVDKVMILEKEDIPFDKPFRLLSPILLKFAIKEYWKADIKEKIEFLKDVNNKDKIEKSMLNSHYHRVKYAKLDESVYSDIKFDIELEQADGKAVMYKKYLMPALNAPIGISGNPEAVKFAYYTGVGSKIGCGFGLIK